MSGSPRTLLGRHREDLRELSHLDQALQLDALALRERALRVALQETVHAIVEGTGEGAEPPGNSGTIERGSVIVTTSGSEPMLETYPKDRDEHADDRPGVA